MPRRGRSRGGASLGMLLAAVTVALAPAAARAAGVTIGGGGDTAAGGDGQAVTLQAHAFVSQGYIKTTGNNYLATSKDRGSFDFTEVGINFTTQLTDRLRVGLQLFARRLGPGPLGNFNAKADWYYLDYHWRDWLGLRAGRVKLPFGLYNDTSDIDSARVPVLLPTSVYPPTDRDFLLAQTGVELYGYLALGAAGALDYRVYGGTIFVQVVNTPSAPAQVQSLTIPYLVGGRLLWETPIEGLRGGGSIQLLRLDTTLVYPPVNNAVVNARIPAVLWVSSLEYARHELLLAAEYGRWHVRVDSSDAMLLPPTVSTSERAYVMGSYAIARHVWPGLYYSLLFAHVSDREGRENMRHDVALTLRFDINQYWLVKLEGHYVYGTADLDSSLNDGVALPMLAPSWTVFLIKTTAYF